LEQVAGFPILSETNVSEIFCDTSSWIAPKPRSYLVYFAWCYSCVAH